MCGGRDKCGEGMFTPFAIVARLSPSRAHPAVRNGVGYGAWAWESIAGCLINSTGRRRTDLHEEGTKSRNIEARAP